MGQRGTGTAKGKARTTRHYARKRSQRVVLQVGHLMRFTRRWAEPSVLYVVNSGDAWSAYLRRMTRRPNWTVSRLAKESGIARSTLYVWMTEGAGAITIESVFRIADALRGDRGEALRAAANLEVERDPEVDLILSSDRSDRIKQLMIERLMLRREEERQRRIEDLRFALGEAEDRAG